MTWLENLGFRIWTCCRRTGEPASEEKPRFSGTYQGRGRMPKAVGNNPCSI